jgi:3-phenylpropionate/trans-cinnamate dioxygenase ferredoxin subunit
MFQYVMEWSALEAKKKIRFQAGNRTIMLASVDGLPYAIADKCPHMGFPISNGKFENGIIQCKEHGLEIDVKTGQVLDTPKATFLKIASIDRTLRTYPTKVENGKVYIDY